MATITINLIFIAILSSLMKPQIFVQGQQQVSCMFYFGDSQLDNGNNNGLLTTAKANYPPYGIDFPEGPTGRFSNGQNIADFLALFLGFENPIPPFASTRGSDILRGLNYASGAAGILEESGARLGDRISMNRQLINHHIVTINRIAGLLGNNRTAADEYLRRCLYVVNMGSNDYLNNYYLSISLSRILNTPEGFADILIRRFSQQLRKLYDVGSRKVAVFGIGLLGCVPEMLIRFPTNEACVGFINNAVTLFNNRLSSVINDMNNNLPGARFTYINATNIGLTGDLAAAGIRVVNAPCCEVERSTGQCVRNSIPCSNRNEYAFFDNFHTTALLSAGTAIRAYNASMPLDASPVDIRTLAQQ